MANDNSRNMKRLQDEQQVRQRPGVIFGTNDERGAFNGAFEVIANSIDEAREGYGKSISVKVEQGNIITVQDHGRGLPMDWNEEEQMYNWELALCTLYASGKYDASQYSQSLGLNGLGLTSIQYASAFMDVYSMYGRKLRIMHFEKGKPVGKMQVKDIDTDETGTTIKFQPDVEVFPALKNTHLSSIMFLTSLRKQAMLLPKLEIILEHYELNQPVKFYYENGITDYIDDLVEKRMLPNAVEFYDSAMGTDDRELYPEEYRVDMRMAFNFSRDSGLVEVYHNASHMFEGGKTVEALELGVTKAFTDYAKSNGKLSKNDRFLFKDISDIFLCVATTDAPGNRTFFKNQTKGAITNVFIGQAFLQFVYEKVRYWLDNNNTLAPKILAEVIANKTAREEGAEVSKKVIRNLTSQVSFGNKPKGFRDASSKVISERELYIVEGQSALGAVKLACNPKFQGVIPVRGKPINCLKEKITRVLKNDIVIDLYRVLGCGMEVKSEYIEDLPKFNILNLKWNKVIICTDADIDGYHIRTLLLTMLWRLSPSLIKHGKVFIAETPLYELKYKKEVRFAYDDSEKDYYMQELINLGAKESQIKINRSKGLGENDPEMMHKSTMNPETRRLIPVEYPENDGELISYFNALLGDDLESRRALIEEYFDLVDTDAE